MTSVVLSHHRGVAQLASAPRLGRGGRRFESSHPDQNIDMKTILEIESLCLRGKKAW